MKAISVRQPWAWLIVNGHKDIENRIKRTHHRGPLLIHASCTMTRSYYAEAAKIAEGNGVTLPPFEHLERGGTVGQVTVVDCVDRSPSPWFFGPFGYVLENPSALPFQPCGGQLGIFTPSLPAVAAGSA